MIYQRWLSQLDFFIVHVSEIKVREKRVVLDCLEITNIVSQALGRRFGQELLTKVKRVATFVRNTVKIVRGQNNLVEDFLLVFMAKWRLAMNHLVRENPERPPVTFIAVRVATQYFWSRVRKRPARCSHLKAAGVTIIMFFWFQQYRKTKVDEPDIATCRKSYILRLEITIDDIVVVLKVERQRHLSDVHREVCLVYHVLGNTGE